MNLLFAYEDKVACDGAGNYYTGSTFSQAVFDRYLGHFAHIVLLARRAPADADVSRMNRLDAEKVSVVFVPDLRASLKEFLNPAKRREFRHIVRREITADRAVLVRMPSYCGAVAADCCRRQGKPYLAEIVGCPWDSYRNHSFKGKLLAPFEWCRQRRTVKGAAYAVYVTDRFLQKRYPTCGRAAGISDAELQPMASEVLEKRLERIRTHSGTLHIGTAGAVDVSYKGQQFVIEALAQCRAQGCDTFTYHIAGGGDRRALRRLAEECGVSDRVIFEGALPHEKMFAWLDSLDLYIQPSTVEGMSRALIEAMSRGLPAMGSRVGGIPELLGEDRLFPAGDVHSLAERLSADKPLERWARESFARAKDFEKDVLTRRRDAFFSEFAALAGGKDDA